MSTLPPTAPSWSAYLVSAPGRDDEMSNWSPDEALPAITAAGRSPLTLTEGIYWALQVPEILERNLLHDHRLQAA